MDKIYKKNINFRVRMIAKQYLLFGESSAYQLNDTGNYIWNELNGINTLENISNTLKASYGEVSENYENEVCEFIEFLLEIKAIRIAG